MSGRAQAVFRFVKRTWLRSDSEMCDVTEFSRIQVDLRSWKWILKVGIGPGIQLYKTGTMKLANSLQHTMIEI